MQHADVSKRRYGLIGSTEFGEDFSQWLQNHVVAYLNVDVSASWASDPPC